MTKRKHPRKFKAFDLLELANASYADGIMDLSEYYTKTGKFKEGSGDGLARFVVIELLETFDPKANPYVQLRTAARAIESAKEQLADLQDHLQREHDNARL